MTTCFFCDKTKKPVRYSCMYNKLYKLPCSDSRKRFIIKILSNNREMCLKHRMDNLRHLTTAITTQEICNNKYKTELLFLIEQETRITNAIYNMRLKMLQRKVCKYMYRPQSQVVKKIAENCVVNLQKK
jgi:hypothetical protein